MRVTSAGFRRVLSEFTKTERRLWWRVVAGGAVGFFLLTGAFQLFSAASEHDCTEQVQLAVVECRNAIETLERQIEQQNERLDTLWELRVAGSALLPGLVPAPAERYLVQGEGV